MIIQLIRIGYNHDTGRKFGNLIVVLNQCLRKFSLVSARNLSALARLGLEPSQLGLARAGKFQLKLISSRQILRHISNMNFQSWVVLDSLKFPKVSCYFFLCLCGPNERKNKLFVNCSVQTKIIIFTLSGEFSVSQAKQELVKI